MTTATDELPATPTTGLTDAEAADRRARGLGNSAPAATTRTYAAIVRENVFTFVNNVLFLLGFALVIVGRPFDALVSLGVISTNIVVGIYQEVRAKQTLDKIALLTRPTARVVRDGVARTVRPEELVVGDLIEIEAGDQFVVDGELVDGRMEVDESQLTGESDMVPKRPGDEVFSGSYPTTGVGRYVARTVGDASLASRITAGARTFRRTLTPLQRQIQTVIRVTLGVVIYLQLLLVVKNVVEDTPLDEAIVEATVLVGLVPNGLFVSIAIAYALAAVRMSRFGALVQQANAVESLSHVDTLCVDKTGTLTANQLELEQVVPLEGDEATARATAGVKGDLLGIQVIDTGSGIAESNMDRMFRPYFTTKKGGTGMGLPMVRRIVEEHGGQITFESEVGKGTRFIILLPADPGKRGTLKSMVAVEGGPDKPVGRGSKK
jgi:cation-transporting ATPase E